MAGNSFQSMLNNRDITIASGYTSDVLLGSQGSAPMLSATNNSSQYNYAAFFASANFAIDRRIALSTYPGAVTALHRFGPDNRFWQFSGSVGAAWIFFNDTSCNGNPHLLSFAKLRGSYGITGNDQIGNYMYCSIPGLSNPPAAHMADFTGLNQDAIANSKFGWEINRKLDLSVDLEFIKSIKAGSHFLPQQKHQPAYIGCLAQPDGSSPRRDNKNSPAIVQNSGLELVLSHQTNQL